MARPFIPPAEDDDDLQRQQLEHLMMTLYMALQQVLRSRNAQHSGSRNHRAPRRQAEGSDPHVVVVNSNMADVPLPDLVASAMQQLHQPTPQVTVSAPSSPTRDATFQFPECSGNASNGDDFGADNAVVNEIESAEVVRGAANATSANFARDASSASRAVDVNNAAVASNTGEPISVAVVGKRRSADQEKRENDCNGPVPNPRPRPRRRRFISDPTFGTSTSSSSSSASSKKPAAISLFKTAPRCTGPCCAGRQAARSRLYRGQWVNVGTNLRNIAEDFHASTTKNAELEKSRLPLVRSRYPSNNNDNPSTPDGILSVVILAPLRETLWMTVALYLGWRLVSRLR